MISEMFCRKLLEYVRVWKSLKNKNIYFYYFISNHLYLFSGVLKNESIENRILKIHAPENKQFPFLNERLRFSEMYSINVLQNISKHTTCVLSAWII